VSKARFKVMSLTDKRIEEIINEMTKRFGDIDTSGVGFTAAEGANGVFKSMEDAIKAAKWAQKELSSLSLLKRGEIIAAMRKTALDNAKYLALMAQEETGFGRVNDKVQKNILAAKKTPGLEDLTPRTFTGDDGMTLVEEAPYGVIGAITPSTNPSSTVINNGISMITAGNGVVFNPHPGAKKVTVETVRILNEAIASAGGPSTLLCTVSEPTLDTGKILMEHKDIKLLAVTGGEAVVKVAMRCGKKVIAAGPGNPPVIVDDTASIPKAAADIVKGASFDNNILCIAEKEVLVFREVADLLVDMMAGNGCYRADQSEIEKIEAAVLEINREGKYVPNKNFVGRNAGYILNKCGINASDDFKLVIAEVPFNHPFVMTEMLMPVLPVVRVDSLYDAIEKAIEAEGNCKHTAIMHSQNVTNLTEAARALDTTIFVKNAPSYAGLGFLGEGYTSLTIATPTGEGLTSARSFTRLRRCTLSGSFRII